MNNIMYYIFSILYWLFWLSFVLILVIVFNNLWLLFLLLGAIMGKETVSTKIMKTKEDISNE